MSSQYRKPGDENLVKYTQLFINNEFVDSVSGKKFIDQDPVSLETICEVSEGDKADVEIAVENANAAFKIGSKWRTMDACDRGDLLYKLALKIEENFS